MKNKYDIGIIGGGVIGCALAYYLSQKSLDIVLLEKNDIASGTSSGCDGNVLISDKQVGLDTLITYQSQKLFAQLVQEIPYDFEYMQKGSLLVIESEKEMEIAQKLVEQQVRDGYPFRIISADELLKQEPYFADDVKGAVEVDCDLAINPMLFCYALALEAEKNGVDILKYTTVEAIEKDQHGAIQIVKTSKGDIKVAKLINCGGVWSKQIGKMVGIDIPLKPRQGQLLVTETTLQVVQRKVMEFGYMMAKFGFGDYQRDIDEKLNQLGIALVIEPTHSNNFLLGSSRAFVGFDNNVSIEVMEGIAKRAMRFFPILEDVNVIRAYSGLRPYVKDHSPIVSMVKEVPGFYLATGHEGDGIGLAPITAKIMEAILLDQELPFPIDHLSFQRFHINN